MDLIDNARGGYRFLTGIPAFSSGAVAMDGHQVVHVTLSRPVPWRPGFEVIDAHLGERGRPRQALCAVALRSPKPFSFDGFGDFNSGYRALLADWDLLVGDHNPIARSNVAPELHAPEAPSLYSFAYTIEGAGDAPTFVVAGAADIIAGATDAEGIIRHGETTATAMTDKASHVMAAMRDRLDGLGVTWAQVTRANIYTVHPLRAFLPAVILEPMAAASVHGVHWYFARPPLAGLEFEMDLRGVAAEQVIAP